MSLEKRELMEKLDSCYRVVQQSSTGISAIKIAEKLKIHRTTVHRYLNILELMGKVRSEKGLWFPVNAKQTTIRDLPSEIRAEAERIKEEYVNGKFTSADRRLYLLITTQIENLELPQDLESELKSLKNEYDRRIKKLSIGDILLGDDKTFERHRAQVAEIMIPKFLRLIGRICRKLEEGVEDE